MSVIINGKEYFRGRRLPRGSGSADVAFNPQNHGKPSTQSFKVPAGSLVDGANSIGIKLDDGGWVIYDYVQLSDSREAPKPKTPEPPQLLDDLLAGEMADYDEINDELARHSDELAARPQIVALNKSDLVETRDAFDELAARFDERGVELHLISAASGEGLDKLRFVLWEGLKAEG